MDDVFQNLSECAALHPDEDDYMFDDDQDESGWFTAESFGDINNSMNDHIDRDIENLQDSHGAIGEISGEQHANDKNSQFEDAEEDIQR